MSELISELDVVKSRKPLPVIEMLLLNEFNGRRTDYILPEYTLELYGRDWAMHVQNLFREGYLRIAEPQEALESLTIPLLKDILRANGQKLSGKKAALVTRITENISPDKYSDKVPEIYLVTTIGSQELESRAFYIENQQMNYGFLNSELAALEKNTAPNMILEKLFARDFLKHTSTKNYSSLASTYESYRRYLKKHGRDVEALTALLRVIYLRFSGMTDNNTVLEFQFLSWVFEDSIWRRELDAERTTLNLSDAALAKEFEVATSALILPFVYFDKATLIEIILARLNGQENLFEHYSSRRNIPSKNSSAYYYFQATTNEPPEISTPYQAAASSGCLLPCLFFLSLVLFVVL